MKKGTYLVIFAAILLSLTLNGPLQPPNPLRSDLSPPLPERPLSWGNRKKIPPL